MSNATRTPRDFTFSRTLATIFGLAIEFDYWLKSEGEIRDCPNPYGSPSMSEGWKESKYFGLISSRLYNGTMEKLPLEPDWNEYKFLVGSWSYYVNRQFEGVNKNPLITNVKAGSKDIQEIYIAPKVQNINKHINLFNASSYASCYLADYISRNKFNQAKFRNTSWKLTKDIKTNIKSLPSKKITGWRFEFPSYN